MAEPWSEHNCESRGRRLEAAGAVQVTWFEKVHEVVFGSHPLGLGWAVPMAMPRYT